MKVILFLLALFSLASTAAVVPPFESGIDEKDWQWDDWVSQGHQFQFTESQSSEARREEQEEEEPLVIERKDTEGQRIEYRPAEND